MAKPDTALPSRETTEPRVMMVKSFVQSGAGFGNTGVPEEPFSVMGPL